MKFTKPLTVTIQFLQTYEKTHPRSPSLFLMRGGEEDFLLPFSWQKRRGWGMIFEHSDPHFIGKLNTYL